MTKITIPVTAAKNGGNLYNLVDDLSNLNSAVDKKRVGDNLEIDDSVAPSDQKIELDEAAILSILAETGGEIEDYLFGIKAPLSSSNINVPSGVSHRANILGNVKSFKDWFLPGAEVWKNTGSGELIYYNNPNPAGSPNLPASEAEIIRQINVADYSFMTVAEVQVEVVLSGWVKL